MVLKSLQDFNNIVLQGAYCCFQIEDFHPMLLKSLQDFNNPSKNHGPPSGDHGFSKGNNQELLVSYAPTKGAYCSTLLIEDFKCPCMGKQFILAKFCHIIYLNSM